MLNKDKPLLAYSHRPLATILSSVLQDQRAEDGVDEWYDFLLNRESTNVQTFNTLWSGDMWRADCCHDACSTPCLLGHIPFVAFRHHLKITLSLDWFGPFKGHYSGFHTCGALLMRIDNIPKSLVSLDRRCAGIYLVGVLPGPKEQDLKRLTPYLKLVTDELSMLYSDGISIKTARHPEGESHLHLDRIV